MIPALAAKLENFLEPRLDERMEGAYRQHYLRQDSLIAKLTAGFWLCVSLFFSYVDFVLLGVGPQLMQALVLRGLILIFCVAYITRLNRAVSPAEYDRLTVIMWLFMTACMFYLQCFLRPASYTNYATIDILIVMSIYVAVPGTFWNRLIPALIYTVGDFITFFYVKTAQPPAVVLVFGVSFLIVNIIGIYISTRYYSFRRQEFLGRHQDAVTRDKLAELATRDELTGVLNRRGFFQRAEDEFLAHTLNNAPLTVFVIDIDHFKLINDTFGHHVGDMVLKAFCKHARESIRDSDCFGRTGGEEFALLLPHTDGEKAMVIAERLRLNCLNLTDLREMPNFRFTVSIGVAQVQPCDQSIYDVQRRADIALYLAKGSGRNQVRFNAAQQLA